jgi:hypothetical protein
LAEIRSASISSGTRLSRSGGLGSSRRHAIGASTTAFRRSSSEHDIYREDAVLEYPQSDRRPAVRRPFPVLRGMGRTAKSGSAGKVLEGSSSGLGPDPEAHPSVVLTLRSDGTVRRADACTAEVRGLNPLSSTR